MRRLRSADATYMGLQAMWRSGERTDAGSSGYIVRHLFRATSAPKTLCRAHSSSSAAALLSQARARLLPAATTAITPLARRGQRHHSRISRFANSRLSRVRCQHAIYIYISLFDARRCANAPLSFLDRDWQLYRQRSQYTYRYCIGQALQSQN